MYNQLKTGSNPVPTQTCTISIFNNQALNLDHTTTIYATTVTKTAEYDCKGCALTTVHLGPGPVCTPRLTWIPPSHASYIGSASIVWNCVLFSSVSDMRELIGTFKFLGEHHHSNNSLASHNDNHHNLFANSLWLCCLVKYMWGGISIRTCNCLVWGLQFFCLSNRDISILGYTHRFHAIPLSSFLLSLVRLLSDRTAE